MFVTKSHAIMKWKVLDGELSSTADVLPPTNDQSHTNFTTDVVCL